MRQAGRILAVTAFALLLLIDVFDLENVWLLLTSLIALFLGLALLALSFAVRLYRGDVKLRLWDAAKAAVVIFIAFVALRLLVQLVFPTLDFELREVLTIGAAFAAIYGLCTTAYRKPA